MSLKYNCIVAQFTILFMFGFVIFVYLHVKQLKYSETCAHSYIDAENIDNFQSIFQVMKKNYMCGYRLLVEILVQIEKKY